MSDFRQQIIGIRPAATGSPPLSSDVVASGFRTHLIFQSRCVPSAREAYRYRCRLREKIVVSVSAENDVLGLTLVVIVVIQSVVADISIMDM